MVELCHIASRGQRVIFETNLTRCFFHRWKSTIESRVERIVWRGGVKVYWKRNGNGLSVSRSRQKRRFIASARARVCVRPRGAEGPTQSSNICITRTRRKIKGQECEKTRHVIAGKGMNFSHGDRVYLRSVMVFHLDEKIWLRAVKHWIMQRRQVKQDLGRHFVWELCDVIVFHDNFGERSAGSFVKIF